MAALVRTEMGLQVRHGGVPDDREWTGQGAHRNSRDSFHALSDLGGRQRRIYDLLLNGGSMTDREVLAEIGGHDMNQVRPRITELVRMGWVEEVGRQECPVTGRPVRRVRAVTEAGRWSKANQMELGIPTF